MSQPGHTTRKIPQFINKLRRLYEKNPNNLVPLELKQLLNTNITQIMRNNIQQRIGLASNSPGNFKNPNRQPNVNNGQSNTLSSPKIGLNLTQNEMNAIRTRENKRNSQMSYNNSYWNIHGTNYGTIVKGKSKRRTNREFVQKYRTSKNKTKYSKNEVNNVNNANARVTSYNAYIARQVNKKEFRNKFTTLIKELRTTAGYIKNEYQDTKLSEDILLKLDALHAKFNSSLNNVKKSRNNTQYVSICNEIKDVLKFIINNIKPDWHLVRTSLSGVRFLLLEDLNCKNIISSVNIAET